jgi:hypothetical protein
MKRKQRTFDWPAAVDWMIAVTFGVGDLIPNRCDCRWGRLIENDTCCTLVRVLYHENNGTEKIRINKIRCRDQQFTSKAIHDVPDVAASVFLPTPAVASMYGVIVI